MKLVGARYDQAIIESELDFVEGFVGPHVSFRYNLDLPTDSRACLQMAYSQTVRLSTTTHHLPSITIPSFWQARLKKTILKSLNDLGSGQPIALWRL
jgi:hypothetical protein